MLEGKLMELIGQALLESSSPGAWWPARIKLFSTTYPANMSPWRALRKPIEKIRELQAKGAWLVLPCLLVVSRTLSLWNFSCRSWTQPTPSNQIPASWPDFVPTPESPVTENY
jgi:hypothetical protein